MKLEGGSLVTQGKIDKPGPGHIASYCCPRAIGVSIPNQFIMLMAKTPTDRWSELKNKF